MPETSSNSPIYPRAPLAPSFAPRRVLWPLVLCVLFSLLVIPLRVMPAQAQEDLAGQVLRRINRAREEAGLPPLERNGQLDASAQGQADDLLKNGSKLGHRGSDGSNFRQRIARAGYDAEQVGENWAGYRSLDQIFEFWLNDSPHRQNILHKKYREIGIGVAVRPNGGMYVVTDFGLRSTREKKEAPQPEAAPLQAEPTQTLKPTARPKPKPTDPPPTRKPTRHPTPVPTPVPTLVPPPPPTQVAVVPPPVPKKIVRLKGRVRAAQVVLRGEAYAGAGAVTWRGDPNRILFGGSLAAAGILLLGVAVSGHRQRNLRF